MGVARTPGISREEPFAGPDTGELLPTSATEASLAGSGSATVGDPRVDPDALLQLSRRVDWRFLLPAPDLGHTALLGTPSAPLLEAARLFAESVARFDGSPRLGGSPHREAFDLAVAGSPSLSDLSLARDLLRPGGTLYLEAARARNPLRGWSVPPLRCAADYAATLTRLGFRDVRTHWHWPDLEHTTVIVPLDDPTALHHALARDLRGMLAGLLPLLTHTVGRPGWMSRLAPWFSVLARKPEGTCPA